MSKEPLESIAEDTAIDLSTTIETLPVIPCISLNKKKSKPEFFTTFCNLIDNSMNTSLNTFSKLKPHRTDTILITEDFNERYFLKTRKRLEVSQLSIMKDDIKNYRSLTEFQLNYLSTLSEDSKIEIIKIYDSMIGTIEDLLT